MNQPVREDEQLLWQLVLGGVYPRDAGRQLGIPAPRVEYLCLKWARKGIYEYGVVHDLGWPVTR